LLQILPYALVVHKTGKKYILVRLCPQNGERRNQLEVHAMLKKAKDFAEQKV